MMAGISSPQPHAIAVTIRPFGSVAAILIENVLWAESSSKRRVNRIHTYKKEQAEIGQAMGGFAQLYISCEIIEMTERLTYLPRQA
jgi:hypothetical protein